MYKQRRSSRSVKHLAGWLMVSQLNWSRGRWRACDSDVRLCLRQKSRDSRLSCDKASTSLKESQQFHVTLRHFISSILRISRTRSSGFLEDTALPANRRYCHYPPYFEHSKVRTREFKESLSLLRATKWFMHSAQKGFRAHTDLTRIAHKSLATLLSSTTLSCCPSDNNFRLLQMLCRDRNLTCIFHRTST
jgi:hypothetical protein